MLSARGIAYRPLSQHHGIDQLHIPPKDPTYLDLARTMYKMDMAHVFKYTGTPYYFGSTSR